MASSYYDLLGVSRDTSRSEIRQAYRTLVRRVHPDVNTHDDAEKIFKQVKEAYDVLSSQKSREKYDQYEHNQYVQLEGGTPAKDLIELHNRSLVQIKQKVSEDKHRPHPSLEGEPETEPPEEAGSKAALVKNWLIRTYLDGRTDEKGGIISFVLRSSVYVAQLLLVGVLLTLFFGLPQGQEISNPYEYTIPAAVMLATVRLIYLSYFEKLRTKYVKIDDRPEPDAYFLIIPLLIGTIMLTATGILLIIPPDLIPPIAEGVILFSIIIGTPLSSFGAICGVGWGVADDKYNLKADINPVTWNFFVQTPYIIYFSIIFIGSSVLDIWLWFAFISAIFVPFLVAFLYLWIHHREAFYDWKQHISERDVFSG